MWSQGLQAVGNVFVLIILLIQATAKSIDGSISENKVSNKMSPDPTRLHFLEIFEPMPTSANMPVATLKESTNVNNSVIQDSDYFKKWQLGRVFRKQYEMVNMLWRKRTQFVDREISTPNYLPSHILLSPRSNPSINSGLQSSTPSFIEFYYLNDKDDRVMESKEAKTQKIKNTDAFRTNDADYQIFALHVNEPYLVQSAFPAKLVNSNAKENDANSLRVENLNPRISFKRIPRKGLSSTVASIDNESNVGTKTQVVLHKETNPVEVFNATPTSTIQQNGINSTTVNDRIRFFEVYDKHTPLPDYDQGGNLIYFDDIEKNISDYILNNNPKFHLKPENVTFGTDQHISHHAKKHITENNKDLNIEIPLEKLNNSNIITNPNLDKLLLSSTKKKTIPQNILNDLAVWSDHSFMAVYIYEPSKVHCDAAGISPHWLVTAGSCLSRHHINPGGEGRTAFVAYCGNTWWNASRVAYVKYSVVHPNYHQWDTARRYMFNIGLVQVVISMETCPGWAPISLMSHQFSSSPAGSIAYAVGWGLDRYDTRYSSSNLPKHPLVKYESQVFSDSCPGSCAYTEVKRVSGDNTVKNVYCLSLPPYSGEAADPIHGSMLIVEGKLCALFLQEERHPSGDQSAEYTGIWRLGPWVYRVARELKYTEQFPFVV